MFRFINDELLSKSLEDRAIRFVLFGYSIGSAPTVDLASKLSKGSSRISGVILQSPISSGIRLMNPKCNLKCKDLNKIDAFCNVHKISNVEVPVFLMHGTHDQIIPINHSYELKTHIKMLYEWYPICGDHFNLYKDFRSTFILHIRKFLEYVFINEENESENCGGFNNANYFLESKFSFGEDRKRSLNSSLNNKVYHQNSMNRICFYQNKDPSFTSYDCEKLEKKFYPLIS